MHRGINSSTALHQGRAVQYSTIAQSCTVQYSTNACSHRSIQPESSPFSCVCLSLIHWVQYNTVEYNTISILSSQISHWVTLQYSPPLTRSVSLITVITPHSRLRLTDQFLEACSNTRLPACRSPGISGWVHQLEALISCEVAAYPGSSWLQQC